MAFLASTYRFGTGGRAAFSGQLNWISPGFDLLKRLHLPPYVSAVERHPSVFTYEGRQYLLGSHTRGILIDEDLRVLRMGMQPPPYAPDLAAAAGAVPMIGYLRYYDETTGERSSYSDGTEVTGATPRTWSNLPVSDPSEEIKLEGTVTVVAGVVTGIGTTFGELRPGDRVADATALTRWAQVRSITSDTSMTTDDAAFAIGAGGTLVVKPVFRASHLEGLVSVDGSLPRQAWRARLGTTSIVESVASLALGEAATDTYEPMPTGAFGILYNDRVLVAGVPGALDTVFLSAVGFLERHEGLILKTDHGEPIVGFFPFGGYVVALAARADGEASYRISGYTDNDYEMRLLEAKSGGIGHHGNMEVNGGVVLVPSATRGIQLFNGAFHPGLPTRQSEWNADVRNNVAAFEGGFGAVNPNDGTYRFVPYVERIDAGSSSVEEPLAANGLYVPLGTTCQVFRGGSGGGLTTHTGVFVADDGAAYCGVKPSTGVERAVFGMTRSAFGATIVAKKVVPGVPLAAAGTEFSVPLAPVTGRITSILEIAPATWYIGVAGGAGLGDGRVYSWNGGGALVSSDAPAGGGEVAVKVYEAPGVDVMALYVNTNSALGDLGGRIRARVAGVWGDVVTPVGYLPWGGVPAPGDSFFAPVCAAEFNGALYIGGQITTYDGANLHYKAGIFKWDGAVLTVAKEITLADLGLGAFSDTVHTLNVTTMCEYEGKLYFGISNYYTGVFTGSAFIGMTEDGTTYDVTHKDMNAQLTTGGKLYIGVTRLLVYNGKLTAWLMQSDTVSAEGIYQSPVGDVAGTWTRPVDAPLGLDDIRACREGGAVEMTEMV